MEVVMMVVIPRWYACQSDSNDGGDGMHHLLEGEEHGARGHPWLASTVVPSCEQHFDPIPV